MEIVPDVYVRYLSKDKWYLWVPYQSFVQEGILRAEKSKKVTLSNEEYITMVERFKNIIHQDFQQDMNFIIYGTHV
jgi:hypothetical protein